MTETAANGPKGTAWDAIAVYFRPRVALMFLFGFSAGLPYHLTSSTLQAWLTESKVSVEEIGLFGLVALAYGWKFVWAPAIDGIPIPYFSRILGHRRSWLLLTQICLACSIAGLAFVDPSESKIAVALVAALVAFFSASQDIVIDAYRIEALKESELTAGYANYNAAYRGAMMLSFAGAMAFIAWLEVEGVSNKDAWSYGYLTMAALVSIGILGTILAPESWEGQKARFERSFAERFRSAVIEPFTDFLNKDVWWAILLLVVLFKLGDAFTSELRTFFFLTHGFEKATYGTIQWPFGFFTVLAGGYIGGMIANRLGIMRALWIGGILQMATNLIFIWPAIVLPGITETIGVPNAEGVKQITFTAIETGGWNGTVAFLALGLSVGVENLATGIGGAAFVAYLSLLCGNRNYTATQYALLSSLSNQARITLSAPAGFTVAAFGWVWYYIIATVLALPGLVLLWILMRREARRIPDAVIPRTANELASQVMD
ncbi:MAG: MFS transporter [Alphaproteobacteria bacterium]|jgi:MFS transporter, PAT family, beta-lactamase induction signal transducer AmpG|nr:MFS transporter [Alphaproteobacteria bacterium]